MVHEVEHIADYFAQSSDLRNGVIVRRVVPASYVRLGADGLQDSTQEMVSRIL